MKITIHRGTKDIGGSCVELNTDNSRILIDPGKLPAGADAEFSGVWRLAGKTREEFIRMNILPDVQRPCKIGEKEVDGVLISHAYPGYDRSLDCINSDSTVYMSRGVKDLIDINNIFITKNPGNSSASIIRNLRSFQVGNFKVIPYIVDHSAFDALAFLVEAEGKRVFYSGDPRGYGRRSVLFERMTKTPLSDIDCFIMDGTIPGRVDKTYISGNEVQKKVENILKDSTNITFLFTSSLDIDRIVAGYKACLKTGAIFVIDIYTAFILDKLRKVSKSIPQFDTKKMKVKFTKYQADVLANAGYRELLYLYNKRKIDMFEINRKKHGILMLAGDDPLLFPGIVKGIDQPAGAKIICFTREARLTDEFYEYCGRKGMVVEWVSTSEYPAEEDIKTFIGAIHPKILIPVHMFDAEKYDGLFDNVRVVKDREVSCSL